MLDWSKHRSIVDVDSKQLRQEWNCKCIDSFNHSARRSIAVSCKRRYLKAVFLIQHLAQVPHNCENCRKLKKNTKWLANDPTVEFQLSIDWTSNRQGVDKESINGNLLRRVTRQAAKIPQGLNLLQLVSGSLKSGFTEVKNRLMKRPSAGGMARLAWGFANHLHRREQTRGKQRRGETPYLHVPYGNPFEPFELQKDEKMTGLGELCLWHLPLREYSSFCYANLTFLGDSLCNRL